MTNLREIGLLTAAVTFAVSSLHHMATWKKLHRDIAAQRIVPLSLAWAVAILVTLVELVLGAVLTSIAIGVVDHAGLRRAGPMLSAATFAAYAIYAVVLVRFRPGAPCGCSTTTRPVSLWTVLRAASLAGVATAATGAGDLRRFIDLEQIFVVVMALVFAIVLWILPDALHVPGWRGSTDKYAELR